jgi:hypothetical protein
MTMQTYAILDANNNVLNLINWDDSMQWDPPAGTSAIPAQANAYIGGTYNPNTQTFNSVNGNTPNPAVILGTNNETIDSGN